MTTKAELESKHIAELHELAADAGVERYRMLSRAELIEKLAGGESQPKRERKQRKPRERREVSEPQPRERREVSEPREGREGRRREPKPRPEEQRPKPEPAIAPATPSPPVASKPKRKRRRRRWGRRRKGLRVHDLLLPAAPGRQAIVYAESRDACTALLREVAADLSDASKGPDPIAVLVDPSPEELADWKREAPQAEIVSAGRANHVDDAIAQARARADGGEDVIVLVDSLTRFAESFAGADEARDLFETGRRAGAGSLTLVAAVERPR